MLFLTDVDHVSFEKEKWTRQINLQLATVSLQVVISLCKRKEKAALKIKAAVLYRRVDGTAVRRFFCRRAADLAELVQRFITGYSYFIHTSFQLHILATAHRKGT